MFYHCLYLENLNNNIKEFCQECLDEGFKFQLARYCDVEPLVDLGEAIIQTASGEVYRSVS